MVGENFEIHFPKMAETAPLFGNHGWRKFWNSPSSHGWNYTSICQTWLEMFLKFTILKWLKLHFHSSPMIGENFEVQHPQMAEFSLLFVNYGLRKFRNSLSLKVRFVQLGPSCYLYSSSLKTQCFLPELKRTPWTGDMGPQSWIR